MANTDLTTLFTGIADSLRTQLGTTDSIKATDFPQKILDIGGVTPSGGGGIETGEFVPINNTYIFEVDTELETVHGIVFLRTDSSAWANGEFSVIIGTIEYGNTGSASHYGCAVRSNWGNVGSSTCTSCPITVEDGFLTFDCSSTNYSGDS